MAIPMVSMPVAWSNKKKTERLRRDAYESLQRMLNRAVADSGVNFSVWSALRTHADQVAIFKANYIPAGRGRKLSTDRGYAGKIWKRRPGGVSVASPDLGSNHQDGMAVDIHPGGIQNWIKANGLTYGWSWDEGRRVGESWHFRYIPSRDAMKSEGVLDHAAVQKAVGASVDGKIGTGTVAKIKAFQKSKGLTADGKVGAKTKAAMGLGKAGDTGEAVSTPSPVKSPDQTVLGLVGLPDVETGKVSPNKNTDRKGHTVKHITVHWWGKPSGQSFDGIVNWLCDPEANVSAHYVISASRVARIVDEGHRSWANGNGVANSESITIECDPNDVLGTLPVLAALVKDIRSRHGDIPIYPHQHWTATECPGDYLPHLGAVDQLARTGKATVAAPGVKAPKPAHTTSIPKGTALMAALIAAPDFPLLRTSSHLCYYGPASGPKESVSGHQANTLNPGDVGKGSTGLKAWQKRMNARGYSLTVDGKYGAQTEKAAKNLQKIAGITQDGLVGPDAWYAAWIVPVK